MSDAAPIGQWLSKRLIAPLQASIGARRRLIVSPDGALAMLPFETLPVDGELLAQRHSVGYVQSLSMMELLQRRSASYGRLPPRKAMLAIGNPVYEGEARTAQPSAKRGASVGDDALLSARPRPRARKASARRSRNCARTAGRTCRARSANSRASRVCSGTARSR